MPAARYSEEFKVQVVREVIEKERTISSVASSYDLVPQTVGNWVARYRKEHATDQVGGAAQRSIAAWQCSFCVEEVVDACLPRQGLRTVVGLAGACGVGGGAHAVSSPVLPVGVRLATWPALSRR